MPVARLALEVVDFAVGLAAVLSLLVTL